MRIRVDRELRSLALWAEGPEVPEVTGGPGERSLIHTFPRPRLLTDSAAISRLPSVKRDLVLRVLDLPERVTEYDGVEVAWSEARYPRVWCPTIDTILLARAARQHLDGRRRRGRALPGSFLEIGCGSGFVAKYVLQKAAEAGSPVKRAHLMDISRDALSCAMAAIEPVQGRTLVSYSLNLAGEPIAAADRYDLLVCNPPYVPRPRARVTTPTARARREPRALVGVEEPNRNPFEGLFLYGEIQRLASVLMDESSRLLLILSSLSREDVVREMARVFTIRTLRALDVPLKIPVVTARASRESRAWMDWLERTKRLTVDETEASGYRYWQRIEVAELALR